LAGRIGANQIQAAALTHQNVPEEVFMRISIKASGRGLSTVCLLLALCGSQAAVAQTATEVVRPPAPPRDIVPDTTPIPAHVKQKILDHMNQSNLERLRGWPGLIFYCPVDEAKSSSLRNLCATLNGKIGTFLAPSSVRFQIAKNAFDLHFLPHVTGRLLLVVELEATPPENQPSAIFAKVKALAHYAHAVNWSSDLPVAPETAAGKSPLEVPQHVDAMLWESNLIVAGPGSQETLMDAVAKGVEERIQAFIAEYNKMNK
jgi:hypothetical protein